MSTEPRDPANAPTERFLINPSSRYVRGEMVQAQPAAVERIPVPVKFSTLTRVHLIVSIVKNVLIVALIFWALVMGARLFAALGAVTSQFENPAPAVTDCPSPNSSGPYC